MLETVYYFYIPESEASPIGVMESLLWEDFNEFYNSAAQFYEEEFGIENPNLQLTKDMNKAFKIEESPKRKAAVSSTPST